MARTIISLEGVAKSYRLGADRLFLLRQATLAALGRRRESRDLWALQHIDLCVAEGESVGVVGNNGAGKSTLLGIVAGTVHPTRGRVSTAGRLCALLELGAGFHPDLTGRENIYLNASLLGLSRREACERFDEIVAFSELESFLETPLRKYSSGMWVRLGFAVAVCASPDVMIVDEVLAVGDQDFQEKCLARIQELKQRRTTFLVVSHNLAHVRYLCSRVVWIEHGRIRADGPAGQILEAYEHSGDGAPQPSRRTAPRPAAPAAPPRAASTSDAPGQAVAARGGQWHRQHAACVFTIVSRNYLHFARTLMDGVAEHMPDADRVVCLCDKPVEGRTVQGDFMLLPVEDLAIEDFGDMLFQYSVLELNTAVKPHVFSALFERWGYEKVIYFDPDIRVYRRLDGMASLLDEHNILLTPHITGELDDGQHPDERAFLQCGAYNLGFLGLRGGDTTRRMLAWWQRRLRAQCVVDLGRGLFVDQKWIDLVPGMFDGVHVSSDPGWNAAYWNLPHRGFHRDGDDITVNGHPLVFFHFSGIDPDGADFSRHQNRYTMACVDPVVRALADSYCRALRENGAEEWSQVPYGFGCFDSGLPIPGFARRIYRELCAAEPSQWSMAGPRDEQRLIAHVNEPLPGARFLTRGAAALRSSRPDLCRAFPDVPGCDENDYARWFVQFAHDHALVPDEFIAPVRRLLGVDGDASNRAAGLVSSLFHAVYRLAWSARFLAYPFTTVAFRQKIEEALGRRAMGKGAGIAAGRQWGLNVVGYMTAESGVGEAVRATLRAAAAAGVPAATTDFRKGNLSPMAESDLPEGERGQRYAVNLFHVNADQMPLLRHHMTASFFRGHYNVAFWYWELGHFPSAWRSSFQGLDEIWVASAFCQASIGGASPAPVVLMPPAVNVPGGESVPRARFGLPEDRFLFLGMGDALSSLGRKNPLGAVEAYHRAFGKRSRETCLVLKLMNAERDGETTGQLHAIAAEDPSIVLIDEPLSRADVDGLLNVCDSFVSLHRAEGFGLPIAEAMCLAKPVIATGWSGNMQFMTPWNAFPVGFELVAVGRDIGPYRADELWADPDLDEAAEAMRRVVVDRDEARVVGERAREYMHEHHDPQVAGRRIAERLKRIREGLPGG